MLLRVFAVAVIGLLSSFATATEPKTISYCDHASYPPLSWLQDQKLRGVTKQIIQHIFNQAGYQVTIYVLESWKRCMLEVELGNIDAAVAYKTPERNKTLAFSEEYLVAENIAIFVNKNNSFEFTDWQDLNNKQVGMVLGYSYGAKFDHFLEKNTHIQRVSSNFQNITKLALERIDFMPFELNSGLLQVKTHGYESTIVPLANSATTDYLYLTTAKHNKKIIPLLPQLSQSIRKLKQQGNIQTFFEDSQRDYLKENPAPPNSTHQTSNTL